jgi:F-type H+-transporting ATPase subunit delta
VSDEAIARVYASALFAAADEAHGVDRVRAELGQLVTALTESQALRSVLENPQIELSAKQRVLAGLTEGADRLLVNSLQLLAEKGRLTLLAGVRDDFERLAAEQARTIKLEVTSAVSLDADLEQQIVARVEQATGKKALLSKTIDETILGGLVLRLGDTIIDGSLRARLAQLRKRLITAEVRGGE